MPRGRPHRESTRRRCNERLVLEHLRRHGASDRAALVAAIGLSRATVSTLTRDLLAGGLITVAAGSRPRPRTGRRPELLTLDPTSGVVVGLDLGHTHVTVAVADAAHVILGSRTRGCTAATSWAVRRATAVRMIRALVGDGPPVLGIGVGIAGSIAHRDDVVDAARAELTTTFGVPVLVDNNARLAGLAEHAWGAGRELDDVVYLRLSAGVGSAVVLDGEVRRGARGLAGELGHVPVTEDSLPCRCGNRGCLEAVVGRQALLEVAGHLDLASLTAALERRDAHALAVVRRAGDAVGRVLAGACTTLDVADVVVAGELLQLGAHLLGPVRAALARHALARGPASPRLHLAQLDQRAGALGGIRAVLQEPTIDLASAPANHAG